jgi:hypothetical protein
MATAVQKTVAEFCQPIRPRLRRPFSESHIARNIQAQRLEGMTTTTGQAEPAKDASPARSSLSQLCDDDEYAYRPTKPDTTRAYEEMLKEVKLLLDEAADEHTATADNSVVTGASVSILFHLKDTSLSQEDKLVEVSDIIDSKVTPEQLSKLQALSNSINDWAPRTIQSSTTTLNNASEPRNAPQPVYPDVERITEDTLTGHTYTGLNTPPLDLLVRTSGVERLSDFMLWQCHQNTDIAFVDCYWPDFGLWQFLPIILEWQWKQKKESALRETSEAQRV